MKINKTILIIGAKSDIAMAISHKFASKGYNLQLAAKNSSELNEVAQYIKRRYQVNASTYELDILKYSAFQSFIDSLDSIPDVALCAVGLLGNQKNDERSFESSSLIMRTNYEGPSLLLGEIANYFEKRGSGSIIGISSVAGDRGRASNYIYGSAKAGLITFLSGLRNRLHHSNVSVLVVLPGYVKTKMTDGRNLPRIITSSPNKIANLIFKNLFQSKAIYPFPWFYVITVIKLIPENIFKRLKF